MKFWKRLVLLWCAAVAFSGVVGGAILLSLAFMRWFNSIASPEVVAGLVFIFAGLLIAIVFNVLWCKDW